MRHARALGVTALFVCCLCSSLWLQCLGALQCLIKEVTAQQPGCGRVTSSLSFLSLCTVRLRDARLDHVRLYTGSGTSFSAQHSSAATLPTRKTKDQSQSPFHLKP